MEDPVPPTPSQKPYFVVRKSTALRGPALFCDAADADEFVLDAEHDESKVCDTLVDAMEYLLQSLVERSIHISAADLEAFKRVAANIQPTQKPAANADTAPEEPSEATKRKHAEVTNSDEDSPSPKKNAATAKRPKKAAQAFDSKKFDGKSFEQMMAQMEKFKRKHGHVNIPAHPKSPLVDWVKAIRKDYNTNFQQDQDGYLNGKRIYELTKLGFNFHQRHLNSFKDNAMEWLEYHTKHGEDPPPSSALGSWVRYTRLAYENVSEQKKKAEGQKSKNSKKKLGRPSNLTPHWIEQLTNWGFVWESKNPVKKQVTQKRSWEDRFHELLEFQKAQGTMLVPQKYPILGIWVHTQRSEYKKFLNGKKAKISLERISKLIDAGFIFDTRGRTHQPTFPKLEINVPPAAAATYLPVPKPVEDLAAATDLLVPKPVEDLAVATDR